MYISKDRKNTDKFCRYTLYLPTIGIGNDTSHTCNFGKYQDLHNLIKTRLNNCISHSIFVLSEIEHNIYIFKI